MKDEKVSCKEVMKHICESLGADLESDQCKAIKAHLDECEGCQNYFKTVELTIGYYKKYNVELPDGAHERLLSVLKLNDQSKK
jgi:predicted anti-sigma-YlaC factor YlaD